MASLVGSSHSVDSSLTRTASGNASQSSDDPSYDWVDPSILQIPTRIRTADDLDKFLSANEDFLAPECPIEALVADICGVTDRVCHGRENAPHDLFFVYNTFFSNLHITFPFDSFTMGVAPTQLHPTRGRFFRPYESYVKFLGLNVPPNHSCIIIIPIQPPL